jgi:endo-1,3(4)-beta-glucanase
MRARNVLAVLLAAAVVIAGAVGYSLSNRRGNTPSLISSIALAALPAKDASGIDLRHLDEGLLPPTNKWFSGIALQGTPRAVFPTPLRFSTTESSFTYSLPEPTPSADSIIATSSEMVTVGIDKASSYKVTRYDELSVDLTYYYGSDKLATVVLVAGSPYVQLTAHAPVILTITAATGSTSIEKSLFTAKSDSREYYAVATGGKADAMMSRQPSGKVNAAVGADSLLTFFGLPSGKQPDSLLKYAGNRITGTSVNYAASGGRYTTGITIRTANNKPTIFGYLPHQTNPDAGLMTTATIYGSQKITAGNMFNFSTPAVDVTASLDLSPLTAEQKTLLTTTLRQEINATRFTATDTYFSGKDLYRSAQLLQLARQLNESDIAWTIQSKLRQELTSWLSPSGEKTNKYFYYDTRMHSIVGENTSFGSEGGNDHHFHYGYFIYAAGILAAYDPEFAASYRNEIDLLVADIANYKTGQVLPQRRVFDSYFGHSWASGGSPFDDGNNQESISEALNAWIGTVLWAQKTNNPVLETQARWMLSVESSAARAYWLDIDLSQAPYDSIYRHSFVSLNWGGKRENATFFSSEPNAKLGILLIPLSPTMANTMPGKKQVDAHLQEAGTSTYDVPFGDYLLMYRALNGTASQLETARRLPDSRIDEANSRSYMYAWILSQQ